MSDLTPVALPVVIRHLPGLTGYEACVAEMQSFTATRGPDTPDELWLLQHPPVYTFGLNTNPDHLLSAGTIPVVQTDRGGQVTYHGPGQLVVYVLVDLQRAGIGIRQLVCALEETVIRLAAGYGITATARREAPGVYVAGAKLASIGLRVRRGCSYHGLALNVAPDLAPFAGINPCGFPGLAVTSLAVLGGPSSPAEVGAAFAAILLPELGLTAGENAGAPAGAAFPGRA